uniref:Nucleolar protein 14 n=1 Tax=Ditylenchus dipsaci TaxID=166011 RepID=A0A915E7A1_9BILA
MARPKQKGKGKAFGAKKTVEQKKEKKINPFDLIFKKKTGNESNAFHSSKGHSVAASRKKGMENRQKTIGIEYKQFSRVNKIVDKRVAQKDFNLTSEQKAEKRFVLQRKKLFSANNRFNLDSNHQEEQLADFPTNNPVEEDQDVQSDDAGELGPDLVAMANFGGGSFGDPLDGLDKDSRPKRRDVLANLIALSKQSKTMRKMEKDVQLDKTDDLNELFVKLQGSGMLSTSRSNNALKSSDTDDYDTIYRELQFDNRTKELNAENQQAQPQPTAAGHLGVLIPKMHALTKKKPVECSHQVLQLLVDVRQQKLDTPSSCLGVSFPVLALVQLVCDLYGTANWAIHPVATPTLVFAMQVLSSTKIKSVLHCSQAMLFMAVMAKWAEHSNRYQPEGIAFLHDAFLLCVEDYCFKQKV